MYIYIYVCVCVLCSIVYTRSFKDPKIAGPVKKKYFFGKKCFCEEAISWLLLDVHQFVQIGWTCTVSNFCFTTCSNFILTTSEICQTEHTIETKANVITHDARILHKLHLPPMMRTLPSTELEVVKKSLHGYAWHFKSQLIRCEPRKH